MGCSTSREPVESMVFTWPDLFPGLRFHETEEKDPVIESVMHDITLNRGEGQTFYVSYKAYAGPVTITLYHKAQGGTAVKALEKKSGLMKQGTFEFRLRKADSSHNGTYTVEVLDQGRRETCSTIPVSVSWDVTVKK